LSKIEIKDLSFRYLSRTKEQNPTIFRQLNFRASENESIGIIGANGVGKSTFLRLLVGILTEYEGLLQINDLPVCRENLTAIRSRLGYVFQDSDSQLFMNTVYEDVAFGPKNQGLSDAEIQARVTKALEKTGISHLAHQPIYKLSGGQKKLASIATVLSMGTDTLLMDEPSAALDPENRELLIQILNELPGLKLIASHDLDFVYDTCQRTILLSNGIICYDGPTKDILTDQKRLEENGLRLPLSFRFRNLNS